MTVAGLRDSVRLKPRAKPLNRRVLTKCLRPLCPKVTLVFVAALLSVESRQGPEPALVPKVEAIDACPPPPIAPTPSTTSQCPTVSRILEFRFTTHTLKLSRTRYWQILDMDGRHCSFTSPVRTKPFLARRQTACACHPVGRTHFVHNMYLMSPRCLVSVQQFTRTEQSA
jgi:hypothetical protein